MKWTEKGLYRWLWAAGAAVVLAGAAAYAQRRCVDCYPCACAPDGGVIQCCSGYDC
jgi:hypothetical protein